MPVSFCLCEHKSFAEILSWARERGVEDSNEVVSCLGVGKKCGMCRVYLEYALKTGEAEVPYPCPLMEEKESA